MRRRRAPVREIPPDPKYGSKEVARLINRVMTRGKKTVAQRVVYKAFDQIQTQANQPPMEVLQRAITGTTPMLEVKPRRVGGATYQVPVQVRPERGSSLAFRWLVRYARARKGRPMHQRLAQELLEAARGEGGAAKRREELHRMAEANRAFAHYRW